MYVLSVTVSPLTDAEHDKMTRFGQRTWVKLMGASYVVRPLERLSAHPLVSLPSTVRKICHKLSLVPKQEVLWSRPESNLHLKSSSTDFSQTLQNLEQVK